MKRKCLIIIGLLCSTIAASYLISSCNKQAETFRPTSLQQIIPAGFPAPVYTFEDNPLTEERFQLGRKLFYDGRLSLDGNFPCASCHQQIAIFGTYEHDRSHGY